MSKTCPKCGTGRPCVHAQAGATATVAAVLPETAPAGAGQEYWRQEVISRVRQHRARRRRIDPNALQLDFQAQPPLTIASGVAVPPLELALRPEEQETLEREGRLENSLPTQTENRLEDRPPELRPRKIIRFPAPSLAAQRAEAELEADLALSVPERPRILDAQEPEQITLIPSFADICLEEPDAENPFTEDELDLPSQPAPLGRRLSSGLVDGAIVLVGWMVFAGAFAAALSGLREAVPHSRPAVLCTLAAGAMLALLFQYLFLVYGNGTPGMSAASLELLTFDGRKPSCAARVWRAVAATLSGISLGLGFMWALVDEHTLGWHDRISRTYVKSSN